MLLFVQLGSAPLTDVDEGAFSEATREMLARGDFISPWLLDAPRFDKPVLIHWLQMASMSIFGINTLGARIPSAIAGLIWIGCIAGLARLVSQRLQPQQNPDAAYFWGHVIAATTIGIPLISRAATADALLNALLAASLLCLWQAFYSDPLRATPETKPGKKWGRLAAVFVGLGLLTKGPVALLIPGAASLFAALSGAVNGALRVTMTRWLRLVFDPVSWMIVMVICLPWYWLQYEAQGMAFISGFFGVHNVGRFTTTMHGFSAGPWYYPTWILMATLPWTPLVIRSLAAGISDGTIFRQELVMLWGIFIFVLVFFSFSATKLPHYGFYGLSGFIVVMAVTIVHRYASNPRKHTGELTPMAFLPERIFMALLLVVLALLPLWWRELTPLIRDAYYQVVWNVAAESFASSARWFALLVLIAVYVLIAKPARGLAVGALSFAAAIHVFIVPTVVQALRDPIKEAAQVLTNRGLDNAITWRLASPSLSFHAQRVIKPGEPAANSVVVMHSKDLHELQTRMQSKRTSPEKSSGKAIDAIASEIDIVWEKNGISIVHVR